MQWVATYALGIFCEMIVDSMRLEKIVANKKPINLSSFLTSLLSMIVFYETEWKIHINVMKYSKKIQSQSK